MGGSVSQDGAGWVLRFLSVLGVRDSWRNQCAPNTFTKYFLPGHSKESSPMGFITGIKYFQEFQGSSWASVQHYISVKGGPFLSKTVD